MSRRPMILLFVLVVFVAACGDDESAETTTTAGPVATTTAAPVTTSTTTSTAAPATSTVSASTTTTEPPPVAPPAGSMLITNEDGVYIATADGVASQVISASPASVGGLITFAIDDTEGGIVFQPHTGPWTAQGDDSIVYWVPSGSSTYQELLVPSADQGLGLEDVVQQGGSPVVYYTRVEGRDSPETAAQTLRSFNVDDKTVVEIDTVGGWESGSSPISVGGETIVMNSGAEGYIWVRFTDLDGVNVDSPANPLPVDEFDCFPECFYYADLSPDGTHVAVARLAPNAGGFATIPEVEVRDVDTGDLVMNASLAALSADGYIHSLDLGDSRVIVNLVEEGSEYPFARVIDYSSDEFAIYQAPLGGVARFLRSMPDLDGVVAWP